MSSRFEDEVVAIGALGGSGTRAVAQLLIDAGVYMGNNLNFANDNLVFTAALKDPEWFSKASTEEVNERLQIFETHMRFGALSHQDINVIRRLPHPENHEFPKTFFDKLALEKPFSTPRSSWGWKEPNTHIFLEAIARFFPRIRYIHVIRHGLDMAFAPNKRQLFIWGKLFGIEAASTESKSSLIRKQLDYWIQSSYTAVRTGQKLLGNRFYLLRYEDICLQPEKEIQNLLDFLEIGTSNNLQQFAKNFVLSQGSGRYKNHDLSIFSEKQLKAVQDLGYQI